MLNLYSHIKDVSCFPPNILHYIINTTKARVKVLLFDFDLTTVHWIFVCLMECGWVEQSSICKCVS